MVRSSVTARKISRALFPTKSACFVMELHCRFVRTSFPYYLEGTITCKYAVFRLFGQYHLCNSRVVVISANLSLSRAICEWNEYKLCAD